MSESNKDDTILECKTCYICKDKSYDKKLCDKHDKDMRYMIMHLESDGVVFIKRKRCTNCNSKICEINDINICLWCFDSKTTDCWSGMRLMRHIVGYGSYSGKTHGYVLWKDFEYCKKRTSFKSTKLCHLTLRILANDLY